MYHLIKKDILMQKRTLKLSVLLIIFFTITLSSMGSIGLTVGILAVTYQLILGASSLEDKNNSDIILNSLPIKKNTIVLSKYVSIYVFTAYAILLFYSIYFIVNMLNFPNIIFFNPIGFIGGIVAVTLFFSISFPLIFKYGYIKSKMANLILFFVLAFGGIILTNILQNDQVTFGQNIILFFNKQSTFEISLVLNEAKPNLS
ncbi:ABC-2 transporter permease [Bacillus aquiflavi]|uniref:ABC-2 transporter permease n=1 Tax=Bacillus aquiflavi TaxID=2672567 RepID=A0A6B3VXP8_9BACI|nr:ABC-2 transporter permease [Bacillus aquiflavi]MBA4535931.1 ABC-2 transporter permease [Bacillus aquiflavi]NEY80306.1 ABC-2 transporter permease [Bacillus aquiflavi]UAC49825.1 ABC-2 transporter permease [Bacillus aquiflavi]